MAKCHFYMKKSFAQSLLLKVNSERLIFLESLQSCSAIPQRFLTIRKKGYVQHKLHQLTCYIRPEAVRNLQSANGLPGSLEGAYQGTNLHARERVPSKGLHQNKREMIFGHAACCALVIVKRSSFWSPASHVNGHEQH